MAAISPSLSAKSRRKTYFLKNSPIWMRRTFFGEVNLLLLERDAVF